ncbi:MAG: nuclear transport factor 2 family protein [Sphingomicrobium sp.]
MRVISLVVLAALMVAPAAANALTPLQQETAIWQAFKDKNAKAFGAMLAPNSVSLYEDGAYSRAKELDNLNNAKISSFKIGDFDSRMIDSNNVLTTYVVDVKGTEGKTDISGRYRAASVWHRLGKSWTGVYHTEIKAK